MQKPPNLDNLIEPLRTFVQAQNSHDANLLDRISHRDFIVLAFLLILNRPPDEEGIEYYLKRLDGALISRQQFIQFLFESDEYQARFAPKFADRLHEARKEFIKTLPKAEWIVDLGGACPTVIEGALYASDYPYRAKELIIVDLPHNTRMIVPLDFREERIVRDYGVINYIHSSMTDLSVIDDAFADLVFAGESIEHVTPAEAVLVIAEARRVLKPGGYFCLDTPNSKLTRIHSPKQFVHPEHKVEYTPTELIELLQNGGFEVVDSGGICPMPETARTGVFDETEAFRTQALGVDAEVGYCFYVKCRKPIETISA
ncbi:MAG TPA: methyltransferase domain-containing protein [Pyrinomonadaceae bacterium]|nr:methyltransferase domain-containing protein [Pyrinomonadaceae bacterium]